jgi:cytochrome oxidase Cu insertion factor (SCO1/SenC/PrrC family)
MRALALALFLAAGAAGAEALRFDPPPPGSYALPPLGRVRDRALLGIDGQPAPLLGLRPGQVALVSFVYGHCPDACPAVLGTWKALDGAIVARPDLAGRVRLVSVSFDPARDRPDTMRELARTMTPRGDWRFLTPASEAELAPLLADFGQDATPLRDDAGSDTGLVRHVTKAFLVDASGALRNVYSTGFLANAILLNDAETILREEP